MSRKKCVNGAEIWMMRRCSAWLHQQVHNDWIEGLVDSIATQAVNESGGNSRRDQAGSLRKSSCTLR